MCAAANAKQFFTSEGIISFLDAIYKKVPDGIPYVSPPVSAMADDYLAKKEDHSSAAKSMIRNQVAKCTTTGFVAGLGGLIVMPVTLPADLTSSLYVQMRMIACTAYMAGFDICSDQVKTLVYACLAGVSVGAIIKPVGIQFGEKMALNMVKKIPGKALVKINQKVGFRFLTKFGEKGLINLGKAVPVAGGFVSAGMNLFETKAIGNRAYNWFFKGQLSDGTEVSEEEEKKAKEIEASAEIE